MMRLGLLAAEPRGWHARDLVRAARGMRVEMLPLDWRSLRAAVEGRTGGAVRAGRVEIASLAGVLVRSMPAGSLEQVIFRMDALQALEARGTVVVNPPRAIECAVDKYLALERLAAGGLETPRTRAAESARLAMDDFRALGGDVVVKPLFGSGGRGIVRLQDAETADRVFRALERVGAMIYQQEFVEHPQGDLRVLVVGGEAVLAMRRRAAPAASGAGAEWRTNIARGGAALPHRLTSLEATAAVKAARAVGAEVAGVDFLPAPDGRLLVTEVNSSPGWRALARATGADAAALVLEHLRRRAGG